MSKHKSLRADFESRIKEWVFTAPDDDIGEKLANELVHLVVLHGLLPETGNDEAETEADDSETTARFTTVGEFFDWLTGVATSGLSSVPEEADIDLDDVVRTIRDHRDPVDSADLEAAAEEWGFYVKRGSWIRRDGTRTTLWLEPRDPKRIINALQRSLRDVL